MIPPLGCLCDVRRRVEGRDDAGESHSKRRGRGGWRGEVGDGAGTSNNRIPGVVRACMHCGRRVCEIDALVV